VASFHGQPCSCAYRSALKCPPPAASMHLDKHVARESILISPPNSFTSGVTMLHELPATVLFSRLPSFDTYKVTDTSFGGCHTDVLIAH
jgi:hypothetical protein